MATYNELLTAFKATIPPDIAAKEGTPEFGDLFNKWTADVEKEFGVSGWDAIPAAQLGEIEWNPAASPTAPTTGPVEQQIWNSAAPGITNNVVGDVARQAEVARLTAANNTNFGNLATTLGQATQTFDGQAYFQQNPDVAAAYNALPGGPNGMRLVDGQPMNAADFAKKHYEEFGRNEGRAPAYTSQVLQSNLANVATNTAANAANANTAAAAQLTALNASIATMRAGLTGSLAEQAAALQTAVTSLTNNLDALDLSQRQALAQEIASRQQNLERSMAAQQQSLEQQVADLQGNASEAATARRAALEQQITELTAAQAPVAEARIKGAEALTTAINIGLEGTRDQLQADAAREGFIGGSTMQDATLARAAIGARQQAAVVGSNARLENAADTRAIGQLKAGGGYSISDAYATQRNAIGDMGATGRAGLRTGLATGTQALGDDAAGRWRMIGDTTAGNRANIGAFGATNTLANTTAGITAGLNLTNRGATGQYDIAAALAAEQRRIADQNTALSSAYRASLYPDSVAAATARAGIPNALAAANTAIIPYGNAGATNAMNFLNFWNTGGTPPTSTAIQTLPATTGNQIAGFGAGLTSAGLSLWTQPRRTNPPPPTDDFGNP